MQPSSSGRPWRVVTIGAAFSANKGAASMLQAVLERLPETVGPCEVTVLTTYPQADRLEELRGDGKIVSARPRQILFPLLPLALLAWVVRSLRLPTAWLGVTPAMRAILRADIVLDLAGISFADGRGIPILGYNVLMTGIPKLAGARVVKCSQALGPFDRPLNRLAARLVLPRLDGICARGTRTRDHLDALGVESTEAADLAFLMDTPEVARERAAALVDTVAGDFVAVAPSSVVKGYCERQGIDYVGLMVLFIDGLTSSGRPVVLFPHSYRETDDESRMNDAPLCREIFGRLTDPERTLLLDGSYPPSVLRALIERAHLLVTSRFHAMISALATSTPVVVVGWSHKYDEVMGAFDLGRLVLRYDDFSVESLRRMVDDVDGDHEQTVRRIRSRLPAVKESAGRNFEVIARVLDRG